MEENIEKNQKKNQKNEIKIFGYSIWKILAYFIVYSVIGFIVETIYGMITKGTLESRQGFVYGPFCPIYGAGAVIMILLLQYFNKNTGRLFVGGFLVGSIVEYILSFLGEIIFHLKWWDYSDRPFNLNGRICIYFSVMWGFLAVLFMSYLHPIVDKLMNRIKAKVKSNVGKVIVLSLSCFLVVDCLLTTYALKAFYIKKVHDYNINIENRQEVDMQYEKIYGNKTLSKITYTLFGDKKMIKTFPNLKVEDKDGNIIYFDTMVGGIKPYFYKFKLIKKNIINGN